MKKLVFVLLLSISVPLFAQQYRIIDILEEAESIPRTADEFLEFDGAYLYAEGSIQFKDNPYFDEHEDSVTFDKETGSVLSFTHVYPKNCLINFMKLTEAPTYKFLIFDDSSKTVLFVFESSMIVDWPMPGSQGTRVTYLFMPWNKQ